MNSAGWRQSIECEIRSTLWISLSLFRRAFPTVPRCEEDEMGEQQRRVYGIQSSDEHKEERMEGMCIEEDGD